jgi:hypothetical protein
MSAPASRSIARRRSPCLQGDDAEHVLGIEVLRLLVQDFPVDALGRRQIALPVQRQSLPGVCLQCRLVVIHGCGRWALERGYFFNSWKAPFQSGGGGSSL